MAAIRPIFHLQPEKNWMNDPNGMCFIGEAFHMFYQHNPFEAVWGNMTWGHAVSPDMVHWKRLQHALHPDMPYDSGGVFSGCCVVHGGIPHILYTGVYPETLCLAIGDAQGMVFHKYAGNPILTRGDRELIGWRDPYVWRSGGEYRMLIGSGGEHGGFAEWYRSDNLKDWAPNGIFAHSKDYLLDDVIWECPILLHNDSGEAALIVSAAPGFLTRLILGRFDAAANGSFSATAPPCTFDLGDCMYAPNIVLHPDGRWILFGWQRETGDQEQRAAQGWQGMLTLPRELKLEAGALSVAPAREVDSLRRKCLLNVLNSACHSVAEITLAPHYEIEARVCAGAAGQAVFDLLGGCNENGSSVIIELSNGCVFTTNNIAPKSTANPIIANISEQAEHYIRIFVDGTSIEVYVDSRYTLTTRAYPTGATSAATCLRVAAENGCVIKSLFVYEINNCYANT